MKFSNITTNYNNNKQKKNWVKESTALFFGQFNCTECHEFAIFFEKNSSLK